VVDGPPRERAAVPLELRELVELSCDVRRGAEDEPEAGGSLDDPAGSVRADPSPALAPRSAIAVGECAGNGHAAKRATSSPLEVKGRIAGVELLTIGDLAARAGVRTSTLRYYEDEGL